MTWQQRKQLAEQRAQVLADMQAMLAKANDDETRDLTAEEAGQFDEMNTRAEQIGTQVERYDKLIALQGQGQGQQANGEQRSQQPGREDIGGQEKERSEQDAIERRAFDQFLRQGVDAIQETRALTVAGQGVVGIRPFSSSIFEAMKSYAGVREAGAEILPTEHGNPFTFPTGDDTSNTGRLVGEGVTNANATTPTPGNVTLGAHKFSSDWIKLSHELLQDAGYDVEGYIRRIAAQRIGRAFNTYATTGTGTSQPQGVAAAATSGKVAAATNAITYEEILDLVHAVDVAYRSEPTFGLMFHDTTLSAIRKLKDGNGTYIWSAGAAGAPNQILSYRYTVNNALAQLSSGVNSRVILAGDFGRYVCRDVTTPIIIRAVEKFADEGLVGFKVDSRHDGRLGDTASIKYLALAA